MKLRKRHIWLRRLTIGLAMAAIAAPGTLASGATPTDSSPPAGVFDSGVPGGGYVPDEVIPTRPGPADAFESGIPGGGYIPNEGQPNATPVVIAAPASTGFDWETVAIGLGAGLAGLLAGAAIALATRRRGTPARA